ncbi:MAG: hypothetical protein NTV87_01250 [Ignavibacteriae bacterium]|nr:hypothetical protein [Ignavibacteriota bacterium]
MRKNSKSRIFFSFLFVVGLIALVYWLISSQTNLFEEITSDEKRVEAADRNQIQYKLEYKVANDNNKTQIISLNQGPALFEMTHEGLGAFRVELRNPEGSRLVTTILDVTGKFKGIKEIKVPETGAYLLTVRSTGPWDVSYR